MDEVKNIPQSGDGNKKISGNKNVPSKYQAVIGEALSHFPELKDIPIDFELRNKCELPYFATVSFNHFLKKGIPKFIFAIQEEGEGPVKKALLKNLPHEAQLGAIAQELGRILYLSRCSKGELFRISYLDVSLKRKRDMERAAGIYAIEHGLGNELYAYANYIRAIEGYMDLKKEIDIYSLKPNEILQGLTDKEIQSGV